MANRNVKFPVEKPYLKVDRSIKSRDSSNSGKVNLSYSYSCVRAFEENQQIIGELAAVHKKAQYGGLSHEPNLFTLTGDREKPVCQPFYYSTLSERYASTNKLQNTNTSLTNNSRFTNINEPTLTRPPYNVNGQHKRGFVQDYHSEYEPEFPDLQVLVQWLKYQFKYINHLWPFSKTNCNLITNLCKRNRKMKMEMLLNNLDEGTKSKLKQYVADMNLNMEERFSLCNESIIEVDISPIVEYPERLQSFLVFLRSIELGNLTEIDKVGNKDVKTGMDIGNQTEGKKRIVPKNVIEQTSLLENIKVADNVYIERINNQSNNIFNKVSENCKERLIEECKPSFNGKFGSSTRKHESKSYNNKNIENDENEIGNYTFDFGESVIQNQNRQLQTKFTINNNHFQGQLPDKKTRTNLTFADQNLEIENKTNAMFPTNGITGNTNQSLFHAQHREPIDHLRENQALLAGSDCSCKCLIHENREDYIRYKNQCLFGKGDENSNRFLKYVMNSNTCEKNADAYPTSSGHTKKVDDAESAKNDYPSVTKLVNDEKLITERETKQRIFNVKYIPKRGKLHKNNNKNKSSSKNKNERGNDKTKLETKSLTFPNQNDFGGGFSSSNGRNSDLESKNISDESCKLNKDDVEKLVCAVNLSKHSIFSDCLKNITVPSKTNLHVIDSHSKQDVINACFESLDYSINSFSTTNEDNRSLKPPKLNNKRKMPNNVYLKLPHVNSNHSISSGQSYENKKTTNTFESDELSKSGHGSFDYEGKNIYGLEIIPHRYYDDHSNNGELNDCNTSFSIRGNNKTKQIKVSQNQIHVLIKHANEVEKDIIFLNDRISQLNTRQGILNCSQLKKYTPDNIETQKQKKRSVLIKINSGDTQRISEPLESCTNKKHLNLNSLKPRNIYRSISSIFKGNRNKYKDDNGNVNNKTSSVECYKSLSKEISHGGRTDIAFINNRFKECQSPQSSTTSEDNSNLLMRCLEKLYEQLERQQKEIQEMKKVLNKHIK